MNRTDWIEARRRLLKKVDLGANEYQAVLVTNTNGDRIYVARDEVSEFVLAIKTKVSPRSLSKSPGLLVFRSEALDTHIQESADGCWFYSVRLLESSLAETFDVLASDLAAEVNRVVSDGDVIETMSRRLKSWVKLFQKPGSGLLSRSETIGLIGELLFFNFLQDCPSVGTRVALDAWQGQSRTDQDFSLPLGDVEVKCVSVESRAVSISSLDQPYSLRPLYLRIYRYSNSTITDLNSINLNRIVERCIASLGSGVGLLSEFTDKLLAAGYVARPEYDAICVAIQQVSQFAVEGDFPRLVRSAMPIGIKDASYQLEIGALESFTVTEPYCGHN